MPDVVIHNAKVYIERKSFAEAVLVSGDKIAAVGADKEILSKASSKTEKIDAQSNLLLPGFNDSHVHMYHYGRDVHRIRCQGVTSIDELVERGREFISRMKPPPGSVVTGTGWNQELFINDKRLPNRHDLDRISADHAVSISRICGHSLCCNSTAMRMAGITRNSPEIAGEQLDVNGEPLGIFGEGPAMYKIKSIVPPYTQEQIEGYLLYAVRHALESGLTSVGAMDVFDDNYQNIVDAYIKLFTGHNLHLRVSLQCRIEKDSVFNEFVRSGWKTKSSMGHPYLSMGASKLFADGSLGARTAYMRRPYHDEPSSRGNRIHTPENLYALVQKNHEAGNQVIVHAIGDAAVDDVLNAFEKVTGGNKNELRHGIVHCQITDLPLLQRMAHNDILAFMQPIFLTSDLYMIEDRIGKELASTSYAHASMKKLGIRVSYGTDAPVESMKPLDCIDCAVNRRDVSNGCPKEGFYPGECVDVYTAVDAYTSGSAYAEFAETYKGRIKPGYLADMTLLDRDIFTIAKKEIHTAQTLWTMVGGTMAYQKN